MNDTLCEHLVSEELKYVSGGMETFDRPGYYQVCYNCQSYSLVTFDDGVPVCERCGHPFC